MDPDGSAHRRPASTARPPVLPHVGRGDDRGGSAAATASSHMSTALGSGGGPPSQANSWTVAADAATAASSAAAPASSFGRGAAAAAAVAPASDGRDVGVGVCSIPGGGSLRDPRRFPPLQPPPRATTGRSQVRLPSFHDMFPAEGAASAGRVKRTRSTHEEDEKGENKSKRAGGALTERPPSAEERASKRRIMPGSAYTGGAGRGGDASGVCSGQAALPTLAFVSPLSDGGGILRAARPAAAAAAPAGRASPGGSGSPPPVSASVAATIGDTTTRPHQPRATTSIGAAASPPVAASTGPSDVGRSQMRWNKVLQETMEGYAGRGAFDIGSRTPEETSTSTSEADNWDSTSAGGSVHDAARGSGATTPPTAEDATRRATSVAGGDRRWELTSGGASGGYGRGRGSGGGGDGTTGNAAGGPVGDQRSFGLKARILERSGMGGGSEDVPLPLPPMFEASRSGNYSPAGGLPAAGLSSGMVPRLGGGGSSVGGSIRATAAVAVGAAGEGAGGAGRLPPGAPEPLPRGGTSRRPVSVAGQYVRRVSVSSEAGVADWIDGSGGGVFAPGTGTPSRAVGGATAAGAPANDVGRAATGGPAAVGSGVAARSAAPMTNTPVVAVAPPPAVNSPVVAAAADAATVAVAAPAVEAPPVGVLAPAPPPVDQQPVVLPPPLPPAAAIPGRPFVCSTCHMAFKRRYDVEQHVNAVHRRLRPYECSVCKKAFAHRGSCTKHERTVHERVHPFQCDVCGQRFGERGNMAKHRRRHG